MNKKESTPEEVLKQAFGQYAVKCQVEFGEVGEEIVRMTLDYVKDGFMEWDQATMMLKAVFEPDGTDD